MSCVQTHRADAIRPRGRELFILLEEWKEALEWGAVKVCQAKKGGEKKMDMMGLGVRKQQSEEYLTIFNIMVIGNVRYFNENTTKSVDSLCVTYYLWRSLKS